MASRKEAIANDPQVISYPPCFAKGKSIQIIVKCATCKQPIKININSYWKFRKTTNDAWSCFQCRRPAIIKASKNNPLYKDESYRKQFSNLHKNPVYYAKVHNKEVSKKIATSTLLIWQDRAGRAKHMAHRLTEKSRTKISEWAKRQWLDKAYRQHQHELRSSSCYRQKASEHSKRLWANPAYRALIIEALDKARPNSAPKTNISSLQRILYSILDELGVDYEQEGPKTIIGPIVTTNNRFEGYSFDCLIRHGGRTIFIDCHGDYWHKDKIRQGRDQAKSSFINRYFPEHELLVIWEYEYRSPTRIKQIIKQRLGLQSPPGIQFSFNSIKLTTEKATPELHCFLATNHYLANIGRAGSYRIVARHEEKIVGAAVFSHPTRKESYTRLCVNKTQILELTRFCIHESYHKKNFASWLLSHAMTKMKNDNPSVSVLLSFADSGFGHSGTIYKASNWQLDGVVKPDYWYSDGTNWFHKKSIWDLASKNQTTESEYAAINNLKKVMGREKLRFLYWFK